MFCSPLVLLEFQFFLQLLSRCRWLTTAAKQGFLRRQFVLAPVKFVVLPLGVCQEPQESRCIAARTRNPGKQTRGCWLELVGGNSSCVETSEGCPRGLVVYHGGYGFSFVYHLQAPFSPVLRQPAPLYRNVARSNDPTHNYEPLGEIKCAHTHLFFHCSHNVSLLMCNIITWKLYFQASLLIAYFIALLLTTISEYYHILPLLSFVTHKFLTSL